MNDKNTNILSLCPRNISSELTLFMLSGSNYSFSLLETKRSEWKYTLQFCTASGHRMLPIHKLKYTTEREYDTLSVHCTQC